MSNASRYAQALDDLIGTRPLARLLRRERHYAQLPESDVTDALRETLEANDETLADAIAAVNEHANYAASMGERSVRVFYRPIGTRSFYQLVRINP